MVTDDYKEEFVDQVPVASASHSYHFFPLEKDFTNSVGFTSSQSYCDFFQGADHVGFFANKPINGWGTLRYNNNYFSSGNSIYRANISGEWASMYIIQVEGWQYKYAPIRIGQMKRIGIMYHPDMFDRARKSLIFIYCRCKLCPLLCRFYVFFAQITTLIRKFYSLNIRVYGIECY